MSSFDNQEMFNNLMILVRQVMMENVELKNKVTKLEKSKASQDKRLDGQFNRIIELETDLGKLNQYGRRNNLELTGIPETVEQDDLEEKVIEILKEIDINVKSRDIEACHRIGKPVGGNKFNQISDSIWAIRHLQNVSIQWSYITSNEHNYSNSQY